MFGTGQTRGSPVPAARSLTVVRSPGYWFLAAPKYVSGLPICEKSTLTAFAGAAVVLEMLAWIPRASARSRRRFWISISVAL